MAAGGCGSVARALLRLCAALLLALGLAMCAASATLFAQWRTQAGAGTPPSADATAVPWFLYCTFGAGGAPLRGCASSNTLYRVARARFPAFSAPLTRPFGSVCHFHGCLWGMMGASPRRPRCLNAHVGMLVAGMVPQARASARQRCS